MSLSTEVIGKLNLELRCNGTPSEIVNDRIVSFLTRCGASVIHAKDHVDVGRLVENYFASKPPFSDKKKTEFPDALALFSLENWANKNNIQILAVSGDKDWMTFCETSEEIDCIEDLGKAISLFQPHNSASVMLANTLICTEQSEMKEMLEQFLSDTVEAFDIIPEAHSDFYYDDQIEETTYISYHPLFDNQGKPIIRVIDLEGCNITIECEIVLAFGVTCSFEFSIWDSIDKEYVKMGSSTEYQEVNLETGVLIEVMLEEDGSIHSISSIELTETISSVEFGYVNPDWGDEEDI